MRISDCSSDVCSSDLVEYLDPVVVADTRGFRVVLAKPHRGSSAAQAEHDEVFRIGRMDAPLLMRGKDVEQDFGIAVGQLADDLPHRLGVYRRSPGDQAFAEGAHPMMILIQRLPARQSSPGYHLIHIGVAGVVAELLALHPGPAR